ncbi:MAG: DUF2784 domain-containing protein [Gemmatimonadaceae bacterium]
MIHRTLARLIVFAHSAYAVFVVFGSLLVLRWPSLMWVHTAAVIWAAATLVFDLYCPLTPWEKTQWRLGGIEPYPDGFFQHHVLRARFVAEHSRASHAVAGLLLLAFNVVVYWLVVLKR